MNKKVAVGVIAIVVVIIFFMVRASHRPNEQTTPLPDTQQEQTTNGDQTVPSDLKTYSDPSGFKFNYPVDLTVNSKKETDQSIYSSLEITSSKKQGDISIKIIETSITKIDDWFKQKKIKTSDLKTVKLADLEAKQAQINGELITAAIDQGALIVITANYQMDKDFWLKANEKVIGSFAFVNPASSQTSDTSDSSSGGGDDVIFEGEEIVE